MLENIKNGIKSIMTNSESNTLGNQSQYLKLGNILNDMAAISSEYGVIKPYNITISFDWSDFD